MTVGATIYDLDASGTIQGIYTYDQSNPNPALSIAVSATDVYAIVPDTGNNILQRLNDFGTVQNSINLPSTYTKLAMTKD